MDTGRKVVLIFLQVHCLPLPWIRSSCAYRKLRGYFYQ